MTAPVRAELGLPDATNVDPLPKARAPREIITPAKPARGPVYNSIPRPTGAADGLLRFRNGDSLHGELETIDATGQVEWRHAEASDPLRFSIRNVMQILLAGQPPAAAPAARAGAMPATVVLTNGDTLRGDIVSLDAKTLTLATWFAGTLPIQRVMIRRITPVLGGEALVLDGIGSLADWKRGGTPEAWQLRNAALVAVGYGSIGRDIRLPEQSRIEFDVTWQQPPVLLQIGLYGQRPDAVLGDGEGSGYWVVLAGATAQLQRGAGHQLTQLGQVDIRKFLRAGKLQVTLLADKLTKTIALRLNGEPVKAWTDPGAWSGTGGCLTFFSQSNGEQNMRISNLRVREWSGEMEVAATPLPGKEDLVCLVNHDRVSGTVKTIEAGAVHVESPVAALTIPVERVAEIVFAGEQHERARRMAADVIAAFHDGGRVTVAMESVDAKVLTGTSENFGKVSLARDAFRELQLHIYDENRGDDNDLDSGAIPQWPPAESPFQPK
ncbi:MAG: hypothetical protein PCFJNLEI_02828 [Verrucomicrobiae bacterium]|nr:hypothetical protein [Verrucomicrobiae bacterium]